MNGAHVCFVLAGILPVLGAFVTFTTGAWSAVAYGVLGAAIAVGLGLYLRKDRLGPMFEPRQG